MSRSVALHLEHADDRGQDADGAHYHREDQTEGRIGADRVEGGDTEDDRGDQGDLVALEEVGSHAGAVTHVVTDVVGDGGRVARVVLGDPLLDLAHEVGADVGGLGEDPTADPEEEGEEGATESESDQDRRGGVLKDHDDDRGPEQAEANGEHAGNATGAEGDLEGSRQRARTGCRCRADVATHREGHADEPGQSGEEAPRDERHGPVPARLGEGESLGTVRSQHHGRCEEDDEGQWDEDDGDRLELPPEIGHRPFLDRGSDFLHRRGALVGLEHAAGESPSDQEGEHSSCRRYP